MTYFQSLPPAETTCDHAGCDARVLVGDIGTVARCAAGHEHRVVPNPHGGWALSVEYSWGR